MRLRSTRCGQEPIQLLVVEGIRRYGHTEADRVSTEFLFPVLENFEHDRTVHEKYNVAGRSSETNVKTGYAANVVGFGWTNAAWLICCVRCRPGRSTTWRTRFNLRPCLSSQPHFQ